MRIIGGWAGGRRLEAPRGAATRPTSDRVREALFSILGPPPEGARVLDLFAGAGGLGFEALSRGAAEVVFVDRAPAALRCVRDNAGALGVMDAVEIHRGDALAVLRRLASRGDRFDLVFVDPPYATDLAATSLRELGAGSLVAPGGIVVVEHDRRRPPATESGCLIQADSRRYGDTAVTFYRPEQG